MLTILVSAFLLGIAFCLPPGAVTAEAIRRGLSGGYWSVLRLEFGSLIGDATWAALALAGAAVIVQQPVARTALGIVGSLLLVWLASEALRSARSGELPKAAADSHHRDFVTGALLSLTNPLSVAFWLGVGGASVATQEATPTPADFAVFFVGFLGACVVYCFAAAAVIGSARSLLSPPFFRVLNLVSGLGLLFFAVSLFVKVVLG